MVSTMSDGWKFEQVIQNEFILHTMSCKTMFHFSSLSMLDHSIAMEMKIIQNFCVLSLENVTREKENLNLLIEQR